MPQPTSIQNEHRPLPHQPMIPPLIPPEPEPTLVDYPQPMVYVQSEQKWQYKCVDYTVADAAVLTAAELDLLGAEGWELCAILPLGSLLRFYFKRRQG